MSQTPQGSFVEAWVNTLVGLGVAYVANKTFLPWVLGITIANDTAWVIGGFYTGISLIHSYALRRFFNYIYWGNERDVVIGYDSEWRNPDA